MTSVRFCKKLAVFGSVSVFLVQFFALNVYDTRNDVPPCWIGPTNCQPKWLRIKSAEIRHEEKYFWLLILSCCKMNCEWDNVKKPSPNRWNQFLENRTSETEFSVFEFWGRFGFYKTDIWNFHRILHTPI